MMYLACNTCGEGKTEYEISTSPYCLKCGSTSFREAERPHSFKNWILHPFLMYKYEKQEKAFDITILRITPSPAEKSDLSNQ